MARLDDMLTSGTLESPRKNNLTNNKSDIIEESESVLTNAILTSGTIKDDHKIKKSKSTIELNKYQLVRKPSYINRPPTTRTKSVPLIRIADHKQNMTNRKMPKLKSGALSAENSPALSTISSHSSPDPLNAKNESLESRNNGFYNPKVIVCDICKRKFLDNKKPVLYCFPNYCDLCKIMHHNLLKKDIDASEIYHSYEMEVTYLVAKHVHLDTCDDPGETKVNIYKETKLLPLLRYFKKRDINERENGQVCDIHDDKLKYYRRPIEYNCKCHYCITFYILIHARIVKS